MKFDKKKKQINLNRFYGYKHWTLEIKPRCFYVGKGRSGRPHSRVQRNHKWYAIVKRYGIFVQICIGPVSNEEACKWEIHNIELEKTFTTNHEHNSIIIGCNFTKGGDTGALGYRWTDERRRMQSLKTSGRIGHSQSEETRRKIGNASRGRKASLETRNKIRLATKRENLSCETLKKRSISLSKRTLKLSVDGTIIENYPSLKVAAASVNGSSAKLCIAIKRCKCYKGFMWKYA